MKAIFTLLIIIFAGALAIAQNPKSDDKIDTIKMGIVMVDSLNDINDKKEITISMETNIVRLYRYKNARINKELAFITGKSYGKLA
ncbi:hypothetical protein [Maribacter hydrothermalis]|uniref:Uncharacterized protein n=1 Tax=Maribacter hydrothermalis TaxID=1836467 RepID=A0A1B7Z1R1_9FLAO|nr:hypothetical protein [Maribacter hydrothermalis]APQ18316.1 hypothetical protein BTR34_13705 [Maribacter hydrothermalis]OBR36662.1 hypothetical protein A9200_09600 [Maribacter hydrothermalis]